MVEKRHTLALVTAMIVGAIFSGAAGCDEPKQKTAEPSPAPSTSAAEDRDTSVAPEDVELPHGSDIQFSDARVLLEGPGVRLDRQQWNFEDQIGYLWRVRLPRTAAARILAVDELTRVEALTAEQEGSFVAVNGGFYRESLLGFEPLGLVVAHGSEESALTKEGGSGVVFFDGAQLDIVHRDAFDSADEEISEALQSVDRLVDGGQSLVRRRPDPQRASRVAVALTQDAVWLVVAADHGGFRRTDEGIALVKTGGVGLPLWAFSQLLVDSVGPQRALNLDGGVSTQMVVQLDDKRSDPRRFVIRGDRGVLNALIVSP